VKFGFASLAARWLLIMGVITALYNPSGRSFAHWAAATEAPLSLRLAVGSLLLAALAYFARLSVRALGPIGVLILAALLAVSAAAAVDLGLVRLAGGAAVVGFLQALLASGLTVGVSWSALRTRISGQVDSDDISRRWTP
jgi:hypothetical protein